MGHIVDVKQIRSTHQLVKDIRTRLMSYDLSELNDNKIEQVRSSEWFEKLIKEYGSSKKPRK